MNWKVHLDWPDGGWQKGATTTLLMDPRLHRCWLILSGLFTRHPCDPCECVCFAAQRARSGSKNSSPTTGSGNGPYRIPGLHSLPLLCHLVDVIMLVAVQLFVSGLSTRISLRRSANAALRQLYRSGAWLPAATAAAVGKDFMLHLRAYKRLAEESMRLREPRYPVHSKMHMLCHSFRFLIQWSRSHAWIENPLTDSTQMDEAFVGVIARFSRRVSPKMTVHRTYDLYLTSLDNHLRSA